jgi:hypothetical protein
MKKNLCVDVHKKLVGIYESLNNTNVISDQRKYSLFQDIRLKLLRTLILEGEKSTVSEGHVKQISMLMGTQLTISEIFSLKFDFQIFESVYLQTGSAQPSNAAKDFLTKFEDVHVKFVIHGSHADSTFTQYSDFDCSVIVSKDILDENKLNRIRHSIFSINRFITFKDPASHHSSFIFFSDDFNSYPQSFMPVSALNNGITNTNTMKVSIRTDYDLAFQKVLNAMHATLNFINNSKDDESHIKAIISTYFISLVMFVQFCSGEYQNKQTILSNKSSFCKKQIHYDTFDMCSKIREHWQSGKKSYIISYPFTPNQPCE